MTESAATDLAWTELTVDRGEQLVDYIMKHCLWQFHSRAWDRERQNAEILAATTKVLNGDRTPPESGLDRCYWVDAVYLADSYREYYPWINDLSAEGIAEVMGYVKERMDILTITKSLNEELTDQNY